LRFATGGEEQEISEHKAVEKAIELSTNVRKADSIQAAAARSTAVGRKAKVARAHWSALPDTSQWNLV
jgi:hypothetical protein